MGPSDRGRGPARGGGGGRQGGRGGARHGGRGGRGPGQQAYGVQKGAPGDISKPQAKKVVSIKNQIRSLERLINKPGMDPKIAAAKKADLEKLQGSKEQHVQSDKERKYAVRYHRIRFFERVKLERHIRQLEQPTAVETAEAADAAAAGGAAVLSPQEKADKLAQLRLDLQYVLHFPKGEKYVALLKNADNVQTQATLDAERVRLRALVAKQLKEVAAVTEADEGLGGKKPIPNTMYEGDLDGEDGSDDEAAAPRPPSTATATPPAATPSGADADAKAAAKAAKKSAKKAAKGESAPAAAAAAAAPSAGKRRGGAAEGGAAAAPAAAAAAATFGKQDGQEDEDDFFMEAGSDDDKPTGKQAPLFELPSGSGSSSDEEEGGGGAGGRGGGGRGGRGAARGGGAGGRGAGRGGAGWQERAAAAEPAPEPEEPEVAARKRAEGGRKRSKKSK